MGFIQPCGGSSLARFQGSQKWIRSVIGITISGVVLYFLFTRISLQEVFSILGNTSIALTVVAFVLYFADHTPPSLRLMVLGRNRQRSFPFLSAYRITMVAAFGNYVFPLRLGEVLKIFAIADENSEHNVTKTEATGYVMVERMLDIAVVIVFFFIALVFNKIYKIPSNYLYVFSSILAALILFLVCVIIKNEWFLALTAKIPNRGIGVRIKDILSRLLQVFRFIYEDGKFLKLVLLTVLYWLVVWATYWFAFFCIQHPIGPAESFLIMTVGTLGVTVPSGPGAIGVLQGAFVVGGALLGIPADICLAAGLFYQAVQALFIISVGGFSYVSYKKFLFA